MALKQRVTISDIAQRSGASRTTVSLVLRDRPGISDETRDRVLAAAQELGYERHSLVTRTRGQGVKTIAILFRARTRARDEQSVGLNPFYSWVLTGMESAARTRQMNLVFGTLAVDDENRIIDVPTHLLDQHLDGIAIIGAFEETAIADLIGMQVTPVVLVDGPATPQRFDVVASDNAGGARRLVSHLVDRGHQRIGLLTYPVDANPNFRQREHGYVEAMRGYGLRPIVGRMANESPREALDEILDLEPGLTALVAVNDSLAVGVVKAAIDCGYDVPGRMSVVGFDDTDHAMSVAPELTTMRVDKVGMGRCAIHLLDYRRQWPDAAPGCLILSPRLVSRGSVAAPHGDTVRGFPLDQPGFIGGRR
jgi:LacI family transcriptional regulator